MVYGDAPELLVGAVVLGAVHGFEPGHGWPVAASYAIEQTNVVLYGLAASLLIGIGHLVSSIAMVLAFFYATAYFDLTQVNEPIELFGAVAVGGPVDLVAGALLVALGIREYRHGHGHSHGRRTGVDDHGEQSDDDHGDHEHQHSHDSHEHQHGDHANREHQNDSSRGGPFARLRGLRPFSSGSEHDHGHSHEDAIRTDRGLLGIAWFAFLLGFAHEEEFEIIALCAGSSHCLELMTVYAVTVIVAIVGLTMTLIAGYSRFEDRVEQYAPYLPVVSAVVLVGMGAGFIVGLF